MWNKIIACIGAIGAFFTAIFYVLFKMAKEQNEHLEEKNENLNKNLDAMKAADKAEMEKRKENEELVRRVTGSNNIDSFNACNDLLSK